MSENSLEMPYIAVIPYNVLSDKDLEPNAKLHYGCLAGLSKKNGYCWATDDQLAEMHEVSTRQILRWMKALESKGYIKRVTENISYRNEEGKLLWKKTRRIYVGEGFSNNNYYKDQDATKDQDVTIVEHDKNVTIVEHDKNVTIVEHDKNVTYKEEISNNKSIKEKKVVHSPKAHSLALLIFEELRKKLPSYKEPNLDKWAEEIDKILRLDGKTFEEIEAAIKWAHASKEPFWSQAFQSPKTVRKLLDRALLAMNSKGNDVDSHKWAQDLESKFEAYKKVNPGAKFIINANSDHIEIKRSFKEAYPKIIAYREKGFVEQVVSHLRKIGCMV